MQGLSARESLSKSQLQWGKGITERLNSATSLEPPRRKPSILSYLDQNEAAATCTTNSNDLNGIKDLLKEILEKQEQVINRLDKIENQLRELSPKTNNEDSAAKEDENDCVDGVCLINDNPLPSPNIPVVAKKLPILLPKTN